MKRVSTSFIARARKTGAVLAAFWFAAAATAEPLPYDRTNPVVFVNDIANDVYTHELNMALISTGQVPNWKAVVVSGAHHPNGWRYQYDSEFNQFRDLTNRARNSGFAFVPEPLRGGGTALVRPNSGIYENTTPLSEPGVHAIIDHARAASSTKPLVVAVAGPLTAPVSAYLLDNSIANKMIVVWLAYNSGAFGPEYSPDPNVEMDAWAAEIALQRLRLVIFPVHRDAPIVAKTRINSDLPNTSLRQVMASKTVYSTDRDDDAQPSVSLMAPTTYATSTTRVRFTGQRGTWNAPLIAADPTGPHIYMLDGDQNVGTHIWWAAVDAAFDGASVTPPPPSPPSSSGDRFRFYPRTDLASRMVGGKFQGSNTSATSGFVDLATITATPAQSTWTEINSSGDVGAFRYLRYLSPNNGFGNVADIEFYNDNVKVTGTGFGSPGSWNNGGNTFDKALDGNVNTFFDAPTGNGQYVGIDTGTATPPDPTSPPPTTTTWMKIADEWRSFTIDGTRLVRYGLGSTWIEKMVTNGGQCTNSFFGRDPLPGVTKECRVASTSG